MKTFARLTLAPDTLAANLDELESWLASTAHRRERAEVLPFSRHVPNSPPLSATSTTLSNYPIGGRMSSISSAISLAMSQQAIV
jgi:hypothetical protein